MIACSSNKMDFLPVCESICPFLHIEPVSEDFVVVNEPLVSYFLRNIFVSILKGIKGMIELKFWQKKKERRRRNHCIRDQPFFSFGTSWPCKMALFTASSRPKQVTS